MAEDRAQKAIEDIGKSIKSFQSILESHRQPHFELLADHSALLDILNDHINDRVEFLEKTEEKENLSVVSKEINWEAYRANQLAMIREAMMRQAEAMQKAQEEKQDNS